MPKVSIRRSGKVRMVAVNGEVRVSIGDMSLPDALRDLAESGHNHVLLDLSSVPYMDTMAIGEIVQAWKRMRDAGGALKLLRPTEFVRGLLRLTKLDSVFEVYDDELKALESF